MKRIVLLGAAGLLFSVLGFHDASAFGVKDVLAMHQDGIPDSLIIEKIDHSGKSFNLDARDLHALKETGVSDEVVGAMLRTEDRNNYGYYDDHYYYPYYYPPPWPRVYVGLGFGYYRHWGGYSHYRPYYGHPGFVRYRSGFRGGGRGR